MFAAFAYTSFYPRGGWHDLLGVYDTLDEAMEIVANRPESMENWHIVDVNTRTVVKNGKSVT